MSKLRYAFVLVFTMCIHLTWAQFVENKGQVMDINGNFHPNVSHYYQEGNTSLYFEKERVVYSFSKPDSFDFSKPPYSENHKLCDSIKTTLGKTIYRMDLEFIGANPNVVMRELDETSYKTSYYLNERVGIEGVRSFSSIVYENIYPSIDIVFHQMEQGVKYDVVLREGADINKVKLRYNGAKEINLLENGSLLIRTEFEDITEDIPLSYLNGDQSNKTNVKYTLDKNNVIGFTTKTKGYSSLTIDPTLTWATYFETASGAGRIDYEDNISDIDGNLYFQGAAPNAANDYPVVNPGGTAYIASHNSSYDIYLFKFNANRTLVWATYFGSSDLDWSISSQSLAIHNDILHLVGSQAGASLPLVNGGGYYSATPTGRPFYARFNKNSGQLLHSTFIGGHSSAYPAIAVSNSGLVAIISHTYDFGAPPVMARAGAFNQATNGGFTDMFLMLLNSSYNQIWGTWLGGPGSSEDFHVAFDENDNIFFVGDVTWGGSSTAVNERLVNLPGSYYQATAASEDIMVGKFNSSGQLVWNTLYGGNAYDGIRSRMGNFTKVTIKPGTNELMVTGGTNSNNLPLLVLPGAYNKTAPANTNPSGGSFSDFNSFVLKFSNNGVWQWGTYWGDDVSGDLLYGSLFADCEKYILYARANGMTTLPLSGRYNQPTGGQSFVMQLNSNSYAAEWSSYLGFGTLVPRVTYTSFGNRLYIGANTWETNLPVLDPGGGAFFDPTNDGSSLGTYSIFELNIIPTPIVTGDDEICSGSTATITASGGVGNNYDWYTSPSGGTSIYTGAIFTTPELTTTTTYYVESSDANCTSDRVPFTVEVLPAPPGPEVSSNSPVCVNGTIDLNSDPVVGATYVWTGPNGFTSADQNPQILNATLAMQGTYNLVITVSGCSSAPGTTNVSIESPPVATFEYVGSPYCAGTGSASVSFIGAGTGGVFSSTAGLSINSSTGQVDLGASTPNTYIVTNTIAAGTCPQVQSTASITIDNIDDASFSYSASEYCISHTDVVPNITGTAGGTFSSTPAGLSINASTGLIDFSSSVINDYEITYTTSGSCPNSSTYNVSVEPNPSAPSVSSNSPVCEGGDIDLSTNAVPLATYSWNGPNGFTSGSQNPQNTNVTISDAGSYTLTYSVDGCTSEVASVDVVVQALPVADFSYPSSPYCVNDGSATINLAGGATAGIFSSSAGLSINSGSGLVDLISSIPDTYIVTNTIAASGSCPEVVATTSISITNLDDASFSYSATSYCVGGVNENPSVTGISGGTFSSTPAGLSIDPSSGVIDMELSIVGDYEITYTTVGSCSNSSTFDVSILESPDAPVLKVNTATVCLGESVTITVDNPIGGITYSVYDAETGGALIGTAPITFTPGSSLTYYVEAENAANCTSSSVEFEVVVNSLPVITSSGNQTICPGDDVMISVGAIETVDWSTGENGNSIIVSPNVTTTYTASVENAEGCTNSVDIIVTVLSDGSVVAQNDQAAVVSGGTVNINVLVNDNGFDGLPSVITNPISGTVVVETDGTITYISTEGYVGTVSFSYLICSGVCTTICDTAVVTILVTGAEEPDPLDEFIIPEAFSPNGDGTNDLFAIPNLHLYPNTHVIIFNRWGAKVYESDNYQNDWAGLSQSPLNVGGDELPEGTFYYLITMGGDLNDGISGEVYKGYVYLKR